MSVLEVHRHSVMGFEIPIPAGWEVSEHVQATALVAVEPPREQPHLRASVVVTVELIGDDAAHAWEERSVAALADSFNRLRIIDDERVTIDGHDARRVLSHYVHGQFGGVCLDQWLLAAGGAGFVVSCTTAALEYDDLWDLTTTVAEGLRP
jgi:hypothetical protein